MLSIGKMGKGSFAYYTELARQDYYTAGGEVPGVWAGRGAALLGLSGNVERGVLASLFRGFIGDRKLVQNAASETRHPGWDLTFSAPKSVSVVWSLARPEMRACIEQAVLSATRDALDYLEDHAIFTRRGRGGESIERGAGGVAALFLHATSRAQDPQLHVHSLLMNLVPRHDGTWGSMLGITSTSKATDLKRSRSPLYKEKMTAGALFRASLAARLESEAGLLIDRKGSGFELAGVPKELLERFSTRRREIEEELAEVGGRGAKASERAALFTRSKKRLVPRSELFRRWKEVAQGFAFDGFPRQTPNADYEALAKSVVERAAKRLGTLRGVFSRSEFIRAVAEASLGTAVPTPMLRAAASRHLSCAMPVAGTEELFRSPQATKAYAGLTHLLAGLATQRGVRAISRRRLGHVYEGIKAEGLPYGERVKAALLEMTSNNARLRLLAGVGRSERDEAIRAASEAWERAGVRVLAAAHDTASAGRLQKTTGVHSYSPESFARSTSPKTHAETAAVMRRIGPERLVWFRSLRGFLRTASKVKKRPWLTLTKGTVLILDSPELMPPAALHHALFEAGRKGSTVVFLPGEGPHHPTFEKALRLAQQSALFGRPQTQLRAFTLERS